MTFLPADSEDGQIFICGIFCFLALHVGIFWHLELVVAFFGDFLALHVDIFLAFRIGRGIFWNLFSYKRPWRGVERRKYDDEKNDEAKSFDERGIALPFVSSIFQE